MAARRIPVGERRARLVRRHHLARSAATATEAAEALCGLHSTDPATVFLSARARVKGFRPEKLEDALYEKRDLVRILGMRRTMFVVPTPLAPVIHAATTRAMVAAQRKRLVGWIEEAGIVKDGSRWLRRAEAATLEALTHMGEATASELAVVVPALGKKFIVGQGKKWEATIGMSTRVLFLLATEGKIVRTRPRGSWISTQYRWALFQPWAGVDPQSWPQDKARAELARRWLASFGPATLEDLKWWTGWSLGAARAALNALTVVEVDLDGEAGFVLADDTEPVRGAARGVALLPALDPTTMGWKLRDWYLGPHRAALFDRSGNAGPTIWVAGRAAGGWAQTRQGRVVTKLLEDVGREAAQAVDREAARLEEWLGEVRIIPRFRTPLEVDLIDG